MKEFLLLTYMGCYFKMMIFIPLKLKIYLMCHSPVSHFDCLRLPTTANMNSFFHLHHATDIFPTTFLSFVVLPRIEKIAVSWQDNNNGTSCTKDYSKELNQSSQRYMKCSIICLKVFILSTAIIKSGITLGVHRSWFGNILKMVYILAAWGKTDWITVL